MKDNFVSTITKRLEPYKLPSNWKWFFWEDIMRSYQQGMIRSNSQLGKGNVEYLKMGDIDINGTVDLDNLKRTEASERELKEFKLNNGDFLINVRNSLQLVGKTCVVDNIENRKILYNHMLVRIDNGNSEMNYFINAFLNIPSSKKLLDRIKEGTTTVIALYQRELNKLPIALPDTITFTSIVNIYKKIRDKIEVNNKINQELEAMAKTLYDYWFVQFDFPDANGKPYKSSGGNMVYNEALKRDIPEGWEMKELSEFSELKAGGDKPKNYTVEKTAKNKIPIYSNGITNEGLYGYTSTPKITKVSITVSARGTIGYCVLRKKPFVPIIRLISVTPLNSYEIEYLFESIKNLVFENSGSVQQQLTVPQISKLIIIYPPKSLLERFHSMTTSNINTIENNKEQNQKLSELRDWLLPMLMNGQVTVSSLRGTKQSYEVNTKSKLGMVAEERENYKIK